MRKIVIIVFLFHHLIGYSQVHGNISIGRTEKIYSQILNEERTLWIYTPVGVENRSNSHDNFPVIYLLDGDYNFHATTGILEFLSKNQLCPYMIVVGILNMNRNRDFLPTHNSSIEGSGGSKKFTEFLDKELIPFIDSIYPTAPYRMLIGHSLSGVFVINTLINSPDIFNSYIAIDPSLWWDNSVLLHQMRKVSQNTNLSNKVLYITSASLKRGLDSLHVLSDTTNITSGVRTNFEFYKILDSTRKNTNLESKFHYYPKETHPSLPLISIYDGFQYIFDFFKRPSFANIADTSFHAKEILLKHYNKVSDKLGYKVYPPDELIDGIVFLYRLNNMEEKAKEILKLKQLRNKE
jgi:hypothetical protein